MRIGHYFLSVWAPGGVGTYIRRAGDWLEAAGHEVVYLTGTADPNPVDDRTGRRAEAVANDESLVRRAAELKLDVLNVHCEVDADLARSPVPVVRTVLGHHPYCPSGSRFFRRSERVCDRRYHLVGCTWGHLVDRCGSARPRNLLFDLERPRLEKRTLAGVRVVAISDFIRRNMVAEGFDPKLIDLIYLPIRDVKPGPPRVEAAGPPRVVFAGRLAPEKGLGWLLRALAKTTSDAVLDVAGTGDVEAEMRALAAELGVADRVTWHGWVDEAAVDRLLRRARVAVFPSVWHEPAGLVSVEAMAQGVPVIGSAVGGIPETVRHDHNGLLVQPNDVPGLAAAIDRLATDPVLAERFGAAGRQDAIDRFQLHDHMRQLMAVYAKATGAVPA